MEVHTSCGRVVLLHLGLPPATQFPTRGFSLSFSLADRLDLGNLSFQGGRWSCATIARTSRGGVGCLRRHSSHQRQCVFFSLRLEISAAVWVSDGSPQLLQSNRLWWRAPLDHPQLSQDLLALRISQEAIMEITKGSCEMPTCRIWTHHDVSRCTVYTNGHAVK